jgi:UDP-3-O-[3-hydroxymyristoyl] N-acetylglucosamine deacetylase
MRKIVREGPGLHHGVRGAIALEEREGLTTLQGIPLASWQAVPSERSSAVASGSGRARTVEHLFAALAALGLHRGLGVTLDGPELPILDGCAAAWMDAIATLGIAPSAPAIFVAQAGVVEVATSRYVFEPGDDVNVTVSVELGDARLAGDAWWGGDARDFRERIAPARTFCFAHEVEELARRGLASYVTPSMVVVIGPQLLSAGAPFFPDEPARHKLLDLVGDLFLYGGPPRGSLAAHRPGHWTTHQAMRRALERGIVAPLPRSRDASDLLPP